MTWTAGVSIENTVKYGLCPRLMRRLHKYGIHTLRDALELVRSEEFELMFPRYYQQIQVIKALTKHFDDVKAERMQHARMTYLAALREPSRN